MAFLGDRQGRDGSIKLKLSRGLRGCSNTSPELGTGRWRQGRNTPVRDVVRAEEKGRIQT